ncbi:MAG TPA: hypothetical protein VIT23_16100 [Terrimicrobiaceae bacterium]
MVTMGDACERRDAAPPDGWTRAWVFLPGDDHRKLLGTAISGILEHGDLRSVPFRVYFLDCVQPHIKHHGEEYLDHAKGLQAKQRETMHRIVQGLAVTQTCYTAPTTEHLAELNRLLKSPGGRRPKSAPTQLGLFRQ